MKRIKLSLVSILLAIILVLGVVPASAKTLSSITKNYDFHYGLDVSTWNDSLNMTKIKNAGAIFLGPWSSEPLGDYFAGPNHVLPTNGTARFFSPLSVDAFVKRSSIISYDRNALERVHDSIEAFAEWESLTAHANSIRKRFE